MVLGCGWLNSGIASGWLRYLAQEDDAGTEEEGGKKNRGLNELTGFKLDLKEPRPLAQDVPI